MTPWREFVMEICSWYSFMFYKNNSLNSTIRSNGRVKVLDHREYDNVGDQLHPDDLYNGNFVSSIKELIKNAWLPNVFHFTENENSEYANCVLWWKNIYLSFTVIKDVENILYGFSVKSWSRNSMNSFMVRDNSENVFNSKCIISGYNIFYSSYIKNSNNIWFSSNLIGCSECIECDWLENQSYCFKDVTYEKERYFEIKKTILQDKNLFESNARKINLQWKNYLSENINNCNYVVESVDVNNGQYLFEINHSRNAILIWWNGKWEYVYDCFLNTPAIEHIYWWLSLWTWTEHIYCSMHITSWSHLFYSIYCQSCSFCLGCIWLKNKSYCILNKQYAKEERYEKVDEIFAQMDEDGTLGQFFPATMNPFCFNDTAAYLIDPSFTKEEVTARGYLWRDEPIKVDIPAGVQTVRNAELDQFEGFDAEGNRKINDEILKKVIVDEVWNAYRVIPMELDFLRKYGLPLPRKHWLERMKENFRIS